MANDETSRKASRRSMAVGERSGGRELPAKCVSDLEKELAISHERKHSCRTGELPLPMPHDLEGKHHPLAEPHAGGETAPQVGVDPAGCGAEHGLRGRTSAGGEDSRDTRPDRATRLVETS